MTYSLSHLWSDKRRKLNHDQFLQSLCQKYRSLCSEEADQPLVEPRRSEHLGLGYPTSRIKYDYHIPNTTWASLPVHGVLYMTVKNEDLQKVRETMQSLQDRFNHRLHYPWILLCHEGFTEDFIKYTSSLVSGPVYYGKIDPDALIYPSWIDFDKVKSNLADKIDVELSTYQMMRYQSGLFYHHSLFNNVKYIWRIEPGLTFSCNGGDPFEKMTRHNKTYGFAATRRYQDQKSTEKIWETTKLYMDRSMPPKNTIMQAVIDQHGYTSCHFWSLFEMMDMDFLMSHAYQAFFEYMDRQGAFFYDK
ncbi:glycolipid 2-alpha-mannosyltransferase-domain-containing protein [Chlamydoabsidia padenii]|nr:glycolipid 2-alpha-mannosyltransferase-domain-containing protein [Chlamydoabsidia padenii]